jgi:hypothetical protein
MADHDAAVSAATPDAGDAHAAKRPWRTPLVRRESRVQDGTSKTLTYAGGEGHISGHGPPYDSQQDISS